MVMRWFAPSASAAICLARSAQTAWTAAANGCGSAAGPAPLASRKTVSLVLVWPSTERQLNVSLTAWRRATCRSSGRAAASGYLRHNREVHFRLRFGLGTGRCTFYTCDLTYEYVKLNADYTT